MIKAIGSSIFGPLVAVALVISGSLSTRGATVSVGTVGLSFLPSSVSINVNDTVEWTGLGSHNVVSSSVESFGSGAVNAVSSYSFTFMNPGTFSYFCQPHQSAGMAGSVNVAAAPTPPTVSITSPANLSIFNAPANFTLQADAQATAAGVNVSRVDFYVDGNFLGSSFGSPYSFPLINLAVGSHSITATVTDSVNGTATSNPISVIVNALPTISITNLVSQAVFAAPANVVVKATATDIDGSVASVEYFNGTTSVGTAAGPAYQKTFSNLTNGTYVLKAVATDNRGATAFSSVTVVVTTVKLSSSVRTGSQFQAQLGGLISGKTNLVQSSTNLTTWINVSTNVAASATAPFTDANATNAFKFYRVIQLP